MPTPSTPAPEPDRILREMQEQIQSLREDNKQLRETGSCETVARDCGNCECSDLIYVVVMCKFQTLQHPEQIGNLRRRSVLDDARTVILSRYNLRLANLRTQYPKLQDLVEHIWDVMSQEDQKQLSKQAVTMIFGGENVVQVWRAGNAAADVADAAIFTFA